MSSFRKITFSTFAILTLISAACAKEPNSGQMPLERYYHLSYENLSMMPWTKSLTSLENDHQRTMALWVSSLWLSEDQTRAIGAYNAIGWSAMAAYPEAQSIPTKNGQSVIEMYGHDYSETQNYHNEFMTKYAWLYPLIEPNGKSPRHPSINRWSAPIRISTGLPNDARPIASKAEEKNNDVPPNFIAAPYKTHDVRKEELIKDSVKEIEQEVSGATGLPIRFLPQSTEPLHDPASIRIILADKANSEDDDFSLSHPGDGTVTIESPAPVEPVDFRERIEPNIQNAYHFDSDNYEGVRGFIVVNGDNEIVFSACYIWIGHTDEMIRSLAKECVFRALGLTNAVNVGSLLKKRKMPMGRGRVLRENADSPDEYDLLMLRLLYEPELEVGRGPRYFYDFYRDYFNNLLLLNLPRIREAASGPAAPTDSGQ